MVDAPMTLQIIISNIQYVGRTAVGPEFTALQLATRQHHFVEFCKMAFGSIPSHLRVVIRTG